jgi:hypothetical protein
VNNFPDGFLINGRIVPSVASNQLTVAIKGMDGNDPSATNPVYVRIGNTVHTITAALTTGAIADAYNWFNAGSSEMATNEIDYFVYIWYCAAASAVRVGIARIPYARTMADLNNTTLTNEKFFYTNSASFASTDNVVNVGRFAATLSAGAGYTWSVPTFTAANLVQFPIFESRWLNWTPTESWTAAVAPSGAGNRVFAKYQIRFNTVNIKRHKRSMTAGTSVTKVSFSLPFSISTAYDYSMAVGYISTDETPNLSWCSYNVITGITRADIVASSVAATAYAFTGDYQIS